MFEKSVVYLSMRSEQPKHWQIDLLKRLADAPDHPLTSVNKTLVVLATPRCGSTMFCEALNSTGEVGLIEEWFNYAYFTAWEIVTEHEFDLTTYLSWVIRKTANKGVFGMKWHIAQIAAMINDFKFDVTGFQISHSIFLYRKNKIAQAVSLAKSIETNCFRHYEIARIAEITRENIASALATIINHEQVYRTRFNHTHVEYAYEDFCDLNSPIYNEVLSAIGKTPASNPLTVEVQIQRDATSLRLVDDFNSYLTGNTK